MNIFFFILFYFCFCEKCCTHNVERYILEQIKIKSYYNSVFVDFIKYNYNIFHSIKIELNT